METSIKPQGSQNNGDVFTGIATCEDVMFAAYHTAHEFPGGVPALARRMAMSANTLQNKVNPQNTTHHLTLREACTMQDVSGDYRVLHTLSARLNHAAISMHTDANGMTLGKVTALAKEFGDVLTAVNESVADGSVSPNDMRHMEKEAGELMGALHGLLANLRAQLPGQSKGPALCVTEPRTSFPNA